jgi:hypothetical protein
MKYLLRVQILLCLFITVISIVLLSSALIKAEGVPGTGSDQPTAEAP